MIYDIHTHNFQNNTIDIYTEARRCGIDRILLLGDVLRHGETPDAAQVQEINDDTIAEVAKRRDMADGFCFMNPALEPDFIRSEVARCFAHEGIKGVKLEISLCCQSPLMKTLMEELEKYDRPLLQHCWFKTVMKYPYESDPIDVAVLARRYPKVKIVMAHLCGCGYRGVEYIADCPNVYVDTSGGQPEDGFLQYAVKRIGAERLLYGSDAPCRDFDCQKYKVLDAGLSSSDLEKILYTNAMELLK